MQHSKNIVINKKTTIEKHAIFLLNKLVFYSAVYTQKVLRNVTVSRHW